MADDDLDDLITGPNAGAYETREMRVGPPLAYVAEKIQSSIREIHVALQDPTAPHVLMYAFHHAVVAFLALHNLLAIASDVGLVDRLRAFSADDLDEWLRRLCEEGSITDVEGEKE